MDDALEATAPLDAPFDVDVVQVCLGIVYVGAPTGPLQFRYDNMTFDMK